MNVVIQALNLFEKNATLKSTKKLTGSSIYIVRVTKNMHNFGCSKPCKHCEPILFRYNVNRVYYTDIIDNVEVLCEMRVI